jgi:hypothetical protein
MNELRFKIFDFERNTFVKDPTGYVKFSFYNTINNEIRLIPNIKKGLPAEIFLYVEKQDSIGLDIYEGDRVLFFNTEIEDYLVKEVTRKNLLLFWTLEEFDFEDANNMKVVGHKYLNPLQTAEFFLY